MKKLLSVFLAFLLLIGLVPVAAAPVRAADTVDAPAFVKVDSVLSTDLNGALDDADPLTVSVEVEEWDSVEEDGNDDSDALLDAYVQQLIDASLDPTPRRRSYVGSGLTGANKAVYDILKTAVSEIAAGTRSSSVIVIERSTLETSDVECAWTAEELGTAILNGNSVTSEAVAAAKTKLGFEIAAVNQALLVDCPYELYWYDKTVGVNASSSYGYDPTTYELFISKITVTMPVSQGYKGAGTNTIDATRAQTAQSAIANAANIVSNANGTVRDKLEYFKNEICDAVSYDHYAADNDDTPYGDPWQLISVFDNDESTNVVCEGYSKAFKYLFDLAGFGDPYDCIIVSGLMDGGTGAGGHMWNLVRMEDGENYLVDVTNCDEGTLFQRTRSLLMLMLLQETSI